MRKYSLLAVALAVMLVGVSVVVAEDAPGRVLAKIKLSDDGRIPAWAANQDGTVDVNIFFSGSQGKAVAEKYGEVLEEGWVNDYIVRVPAGLLEELAGEDSVAAVMPANIPKKQCNDEVRSVMGVDPANSPPFNLNGTGVTVSEWDGGWIESTHWDFAGRLTIGDAGCSDTYCSNDDHATHVGGTMAGDGNRSQTYGGSGLQWRGNAPNATIVSWEWPDNSAEMINETNVSVALYNSVLSTNSWSYDTTLVPCSWVGDYDQYTALYDNFTRGVLIDGPITILFAAGNERNDGICSSNDPWNTTVGPGATAKNTITVGAVDKSKGMTVFSSWGPTDDGRLKPDVVGVGQSVYSTSTGNDYTSKSGTSMATPAVAGAVALLVEEWRNNHTGDPLPSTVKALLIQGAEDLNNTGPDFTTGYGLVNATETITSLRADVAQSRRVLEGTVTNGGYDEYNVTVSGEAELKVTLVWSDYPGPTGAAKELVNDLDLLVYNSTGQRFYPWTLDPANPGTPAVNTSGDSRNPVEQVQVFSPNSGGWTIRVNGTYVPEGMQGYSIVTNIPLDADPPAITLVYPTPDNNSATGLDWVYINASLSENASACLLEWYNSSGSQNVSMTINNAEENTTCYKNMTELADYQYAWLMYANDSAGYMNQTGVRFVTVDTSGPYFSGYSRQPDPPNEDQDVQLNVTASDMLSAVHTVLLEWNGTDNYTAWNVSSGYFMTIGAGNYSAHENVTYRWIANDTLGNSNSSQVFWFVVENQAPAIENLTLNSTDPNNYTNGTLQVFWDFLDQDAGDAEQGSQVKWYNCSSEVAELENATQVGSGNTTRGETWNVSARVWDGYNWSSWYSSPGLYINNSPPTNPVLAGPDNQSNYSSSNVTFEYNSTDLDNDTLTYYLFSGGSVVNVTQENSTEVNFPDGTHSWYIIAGDGQANSSASETRVFTVDTIPPGVSPSVVTGKVLYGENITVSAAVTNEDHRDQVWFNISNSSWSDLGAMALYSFPIYRGNYSQNISEGWYNITVFANDTFTNENSSYAGAAEVAPARNLTVSVRDRDGNLTTVNNITVVDREIVQNDNQSSFTVPRGSWDIEVETGTSLVRFKFLQVNVTENATSNFTFDYNISITPPAGIGVNRSVGGVALETGFNFSSAKFWMEFNGSEVNWSRSLSCWQCGNWNMTGRACLGSWANMTSSCSIDNVSNLTEFQGITSLSGFMLAEENYCGDGIKDPGEDCDGGDLGGQSCTGLGYVSGSLGCTAGCALDASGCSSGDGEEPSGGGGGPSTATTGAAGINITDYPDTVEAVRGGSRDFTLDVENTGGKNLTGVKLNFTSDCAGCIFSVDPENTTVEVNRTKRFLANVYVPGSQETGSYTLWINASSSEGAKSGVESGLTVMMCSPGGERCTGDVLETCSTDGLEWAGQACEWGCEAGACRSEPVGPGEGPGDGPVETPWEWPGIDPVWIAVAAVIAAGCAGGLYYFFRVRKKGVKKSNYPQLRQEPVL